MKTIRPGTHNLVIKNWMNNPLLVSRAVQSHCEKKSMSRTVPQTLARLIKENLNTYCAPGNGCLDDLWCNLRILLSGVIDIGIITKKKQISTNPQKKLMSGTSIQIWIIFMEYYCIKGKVDSEKIDADKDTISSPILQGEGKMTKVFFSYNLI